MPGLVVECSVQSHCSRWPERFGQAGAMRAISEVQDWWEGEDHRYYRVLADDGSRIILRLDLATDRWQIWNFQSAETVK